MTTPTAIQQLLAATIEATLRAAGNPFGLHPPAAIVLTPDQRKALVACHMALYDALAGAEHQQRIADGLVGLCARLLAGGPR